MTVQKMIQADFDKAKKIKTVTPCSAYWVLLQSELGETPTYKTPVNDVREAVLNHEMYQNVFNLGGSAFPYSFVYFGSRLMFIISYNGRVWKKDGTELDINLIKQFCAI